MILNVILLRPMKTRLYNILRCDKSESLVINIQKGMYGPVVLRSNADLR